MRLRSSLLIVMTAALLGCSGDSGGVGAHAHDVIATLAPGEETTRMEGSFRLVLKKWNEGVTEVWLYDLWLESFRERLHFPVDVAPKDGFPVTIDKDELLYVRLTFTAELPFVAERLDTSCNRSSEDAWCLELGGAIYDSAADEFWSVGGSDLNPITIVPP